MWNGKGHFIYVASLAYAMMVSYYYTFMIAILIVIYCVIRFFTEEGRSVKKLVTLLTRFLVFSIIAVGISMFFEFPVMMNISQSGRMNSTFDIPLFSLTYLSLMVSHAFSCVYLGGDAIFGISAVAVIGLLCFWEKR